MLVSVEQKTFDSELPQNSRLADLFLPKPQQIENKLIEH
jgi:hypothetical protein